MKIRERDKIIYLGFFLFALSIIAAALNVETGIALLIASFGTLVFGSLLKS